MTFAELSIHPALAEALAARGYQTPTGVQAAVLDTASHGRDLLVSSHTGSGKTVAFGAAMADSLLTAGETRVPHGPNPIALVIVPTRELAVQVREELRWLYGSAQVRLASFTGGTPVMGDLKALRRGVELVIGTPGRLVDLLRREALKLTDLRVVVLDEADEMLDLGFREDLETLLQASPATRRTLLLSATLPPEIRTLARRYQRDALAIDPRKSGGAGAGTGKGAHEDITHRAHLIASGDRLAAVVNVLRAGDTTRAIVFCTTREGVAEMQGALAARGFAATAISGDRAQAERDRALEQLRRGEARVLVATNVAARGLHLPDVDLIVHADLPLNADSLIHRSGRTGRAGRKGTAVVLATVAERRKAERLLGAAQVKVDWTPAPSAEAIAEAERGRLSETLAGDAAPLSPEVASAADELLGQLRDKISDGELLRRLVAREIGRLPAGETLRAVSISRDQLHRREPGDRQARAHEGDPAFRHRQTHAQFAREGVTFRINLGANERADPRWLLPLICRRGGVTRREVGAIRIGPQDTTFEIAGDAAADFALAASEPDPRARHVVITRADSAPAWRPPQGRERNDHSPRPPAPSSERARPSQPERATPPARLPGGYQPVQRRAARPAGNERPRTHPRSRPPGHPRSQAPGPAPGRPRPHRPDKPAKHRDPR